MTLTPEQFEAAHRFIGQHARPVDRALYSFYFEDGPSEAVLAELEAYQNEDGGFGHGIEADFRTPRSTPMATTVGLQYATAVGTPSDHTVVTGALGYLLNSYDEDHAYWPFTLPYVKEAPHAPWWATDTVAQPPPDQWANPSAEAFGYLFAYAEHVPERRLTDAERILTYRIAQPESTTNLYSLLCWERAVPYLPKMLRERVENKVKDTYSTLDLSPETLGELTVFMLTHSPESLLGQAQPEGVRARLATVIEQQGEDGGWWPGWQWGQYEETWQEAKREWAGKLTVEALLTLHNYEMIAEGV